MSSKILPLHKKILSKFPQPFSFCFAYGSGVKKQLGYEGKKKNNVMIDFIFVVDNPLDWHRRNLKMNESHYSVLKYMGPDLISRFQNKTGAGVYFNTLIPIEDEGVTIKYGITSTDNLLKDLYTWKYLYLAGRLHKPVEIINQPSDGIRMAINNNLKSAVHTALLLLPDSFSDFQLFFTISRLSYNGDFRMIFGENKKKVQNIVKPQIDAFNNLYDETFQTHFSDFMYRRAIGDARFENSQSLDPKTRFHHLQYLPYPVKAKLMHSFTKKIPEKNEIDEHLKRISHNKKHAMLLQETLRSIVWNSSVWQSIKNIPTAGVTKSIRYSWSKVLKTFSK